MMARSLAHIDQEHRDSQGDVFDKLCRDIRQSLKLWHDPNDFSPLDHLLLFKKVRRTYTNSNRRITNDLLLNALETLGHVHPDAATLLRLRFLNVEPAFTAAHKLGIAQSTVYRQQREAIAKLAEIILQEERQVRLIRRTEYETRLNAPSYERYFGIETLISTLLGLLTDSDYWLIGVEGIGGIGKTTLVDIVTRLLIEQDVDVFEDFAWVSAQQKFFHLSGEIRPAINQPALTTQKFIRSLAEQLLHDIPSEIFATPDKTLPILQKRLKDTPHLVIVDNLETIEDLELLLPLLRRMANPSKFVLTSRQSLYAEPGVYPFRIPELDHPSAIELIRYTTQSIGLSEFTSYSEAELAPIIDVVGGNPLALRLVVGQMYIQDPEVVLHNLRSAQGRSVEQLYTFIYRQAWESLDENARIVFLATPLLPGQGESIQFLLDISNLDPSLFHDALNTLVRLNLVNRHKNQENHQIFTIHGLTKSFLAEQIIKWQ